ncbi:MAG: DUF1732 domain-containing protein [Pseudomonadota bacterium]
MKSMTGYAALDRETRRWELRSVNARGLDIRLRLPDLPGLEPMARAAVSGVAARGNVSLGLRLGTGAAAGPQLDETALDAALEALRRIDETAAARHVALAPPSAADILGLRGLFEARDAGDALTLADCEADLAALTAAFDADRRREGTAIAEVLAGHVAAIARLTEAAADLAPARAAHLSRSLEEALARLGGAAVDGARLEQEIALLAVKGDVTEEIDRLRTHVVAARALLADDAPVGRRFDFLTQEFVREANTLCSKSGMAELTTIGLALKAEIDRLREQVANVE